MKVIVVDTTILVDIFLESRARHSQAKKLGQFLIENKIRVKIPFHALFELSSAMKNEALEKSLEPFKGFTENNPLLIDPVPIDESFFSKYFDNSLPYSKAGDLLFIALAKGENAVLITEDDKQYKKSKESGVSTYRIDDYLTEFVYKS